MINRLTSFIIAILSLVGFFASLKLGLHGAIAVSLAVSFFVCLSASIDQRTKAVRIGKRCLGGLLILEMARRLLVFSDQNYVFTFTVGFCGLVLLLDHLALWLTRPTRTNTPNQTLKRTG